MKKKKGKNNDEIEESLLNEQELYTDLEPVRAESLIEVKPYSFDKPKYFIKRNDTIVLKSFTVTPDDLANNQGIADILIKLGLEDQLEKR